MVAIITLDRIKSKTIFPSWITLFTDKILLRRIKALNQNNKNNKEENLIKKPKEITFNEGRNKMASTDKIW